MMEKIGLTYFTGTPEMAELLCQLVNNPEVILVQTSPADGEKLHIRPALMRDGTLVFGKEIIATLEDWLGVSLNIKHVIITGDLDDNQARFLKKSRYTVRVIHITQSEIFYTDGYALKLPISWSYRKCLKKIIGHIHMRDNVKDHMLRRLGTRTHPACIRVDELDESHIAFVPTALTSATTFPEVSAQA